MLKLFLWLKYIHKRKIVFLSIAAITLSCALLIVVNSLFTGLIDGIERSTAAQAGDILMWAGSAAIPRYDAFLDGLKELQQVEAAAPVNFGGGLLHLESGDVREVMIQGIEPKREEKFTDWKNSLLRQNKIETDVGFEVPNNPNGRGVWLGVNIVAEPNEKTDEYDFEKLREFIGRQVVLTTVGFGQKRKVIKLRVSDIAFTKTYYGDKTLYLPFREYHQIEHGHQEAEHARMVKIKLIEGIDPQLMKPVIRGKWEQFATTQLNWQQDAIAKMGMMTVRENFGEYLSELNKQMQVLLLIFGVICSVVVLLIFCIFYMIVETRLKDIAIIKSCGATSGSVALVFTGFGACIGIVGSIFGIIVGYLITRNVDTIEQWVRIVFGIKLWRSSSYMLNVIPNQVNWPAVWPIVLAAVLASVIGALIPAIAAARTNPVEILRYE
jgi:ABC-type lipoprotein release transport system permease subunit